MQLSERIAARTKRTRRPKVGLRPRFPDAIELQLRKSLGLLFKPVADEIKSEAFKARVDDLLRKYQVLDALDDDMDVVLGILQDEWDDIAAFDLRRSLRRFANRIEGWNGIELTRSARSIGDLSFALSEADLGVQRELFVARSTALIQGVSDEQRKRITDTILRGVQSGMRPETIAESLEEAASLGATRAAFIARDQVGSYNAALTEERMTANGVDKFMWSTSRDERVRDSHAELEGEIFEWADPPIVDGEPTVPGEAILCRCVAVPVIE